MLCQSRPHHGLRKDRHQGIPPSSSCGKSRVRPRAWLVPVVPVVSSHAHILFSASPSGWKPFTTKAPVLGAIIIATLGPAVTIEVLAQRSQSQGGLALSDSAEQVPALTMIAYHHLPTTIAVIYSLAWTWIDLDVLMPIDQQATAMDISILNAAYGATWLDQDAPEYTTSDFAILPFTISDQRTTASCQSSAANAVLSAHLHPAPQSQRPFRVKP